MQACLACDKACNVDAEITANPPHILHGFKFQTSVKWLGIFFLFQCQANAVCFLLPPLTPYSDHCFVLVSCFDLAFLLFT